jgi:F0F1-type ATP synthase membrane subunit b/b'
VVVAFKADICRTAEPFDVNLSKSVQKLREEADQLTAEVVKARKSLPLERANALQARFELIDERRSEEEQQRRKVEGEAEEQRSKKTEEAKRPKGESKIVLIKDVVTDVTLSSCTGTSRTSWSHSRVGSQ